MRRESSEQPILKFAQVSFIPKELSIGKAYKIFEDDLYKMHKTLREIRTIAAMQRAYLSPPSNTASVLWLRS